MADHRQQAENPRRQLARIFNTTLSDQEVGSWLITEDLFASDLSAPLRPDSAAERGHALRAVAWRLIEDHNRQFRKSSKKAACANEKCAQCAKPRQWHLMALLYSWDDDAGLQRPKSIKELYTIGKRAKAERKRVGNPAGLRRRPDEPLFDDPFVRQGYSERTYGNAKAAVLDALYAHLTDPDDPIVLRALRELAKTPPEPVADRQEIRLPTTPLDVAPPGQTSAPPAARLDPAPAYSHDIPAPLYTDETTLPGRDATTQSRTFRPPRFMRQWRLWVRVVAVIAVLLACLITTGTPPFVSTLTWSGAGLSGWLIARQGIAREPPILVVVSLRSGAWRALWPPQNVVDGQSQVTQFLQGTNSITAPAFTARGNQIAFVAKDSNQVASIYMATLVIGADGWPTFAGLGPQRLMECKCGAMTWTPSGQWLLYNSPGGLMAVARDGSRTRTITNDGRDGWPACSPDGRYLAYQRDQHGIVAIPTTDCLPDAHSSGQMRFLNGYTPAWNPSWSPDGRSLSFVSNAAGHSAVYVVPFIGFADHLQYLVRDTAQAVSGFGCGNPIWAQRIASVGINAPPAIVFACDRPTSDDHHGTLGASSGLTVPRWSSSLSEGIMNRDSLCWIPLERL
ncbi:MAG TPA: hypothetical protein VH591_05810 [Ktedonobacterales bacterium]|jgi:hypothetical protein